MSKTIYYACKYAPLELFAGYGACLLYTSDAADE